MMTAVEGGVCFRGRRDRRYEYFQGEEGGENEEGRDVWVLKFGLSGEKGGRGLGALVVGGGFGYGGGSANVFRCKVCCCTFSRWGGGFVFWLQE